MVGGLVQHQQRALRRWGRRRGTIERAGQQAANSSTPRDTGTPPFLPSQQPERTAALPLHPPRTWVSMNLASARRAFSPPLSHSTCGSSSGAGE